MSFWDNVKKFAQPYSDDEYDDFDEEEETTEEYEKEPVEQPRASRPRRTPPFSSASADESTSTATNTATGFSGQVVGGGNKQEVVLFHPANFNDTSKAADYLRSKKAVIVNMENVDKAMARRVVDFLSGCVYAVDGSVKKVAQSAYIFCPHNMDVVGDLEALQAEVENYI
jgi:cell division inhibitor SepF